ncbi:DinB family protein [Neobacillus piezotolerans]|uniref:DinB family protein n=1 Tax=Neobacillus piezotolerans TaxID=2259171 RepID=A0A3D8GN48_9BACI|nr:DinB family protein [Neobacillus piezotolerans]RDU35711.1 DinB family protein [Neobacillus piezotolerans]
MNFSKNTLNQIKFVLDTITDIADQLKEEDLKFRPTENKHSVGELFEHLAMICLADLRIAQGFSKEEMDTFYSGRSYKTIPEIKASIAENYQILKEAYLGFSEKELNEQITSYWGVTYSRFEWLLEILAHLCHHRGQLHAILVHCLHKDPGIPLFE